MLVCVEPAGRQVASVRRASRQTSCLRDRIVSEFRISNTPRAGCASSRSRSARPYAHYSSMPRRQPPSATPSSSWDKTSQDKTSPSTAPPPAPAGSAYRLFRTLNTSFLPHTPTSHTRCQQSALHQNKALRPPPLTALMLRVGDQAAPRLRDGSRPHAGRSDNAVVTERATARVSPVTHRTHNFQV